MHEVHVVHPRQFPPAAPDVHQEQDTSPPATTVVMPGQAEQVAEEIRDVSPEGKPADPKIGPAGLWMLICAAWLAIALVALIVGVWIDWVLGVAVLCLGTLAMMFNPVIFATTSRAKERREVLELHQPHEPIP